MDDTRTAAFPVDPDATPVEQALLDEYNAVMAAIRVIEAGERAIGTTEESLDAKGRLWEQAHEIRRRAEATDGAK